MTSKWYPREDPFGAEAIRPRRANENAPSMRYYVVVKEHIMECAVIVYSHGDHHHHFAYNVRTNV